MIRIKGNWGCFRSLIDFGEWINHAVIWHYQQTSHHSTWLLTWYCIHSLSKECLPFLLDLKIINEKCRHILKNKNVQLLTVSQSQTDKSYGIDTGCQIWGLIYLPNYQRSCMPHRMNKQATLMNCLGRAYFEI